MESSGTSTVRRGALTVEGRATLEDGHLVVWVESWGHGIYGKARILAPGKVIYRVGDQAGRPVTR